MEYNVLIVDDEQMARQLLEAYVSQLPHLHVVKSCSNALDAKAVLARQQVDIILCDIQMPGVSGIEFVTSLSSAPAVVFTTAYSQYAIDGFDLNAVDYLLKPIAFHRFQLAMEKAVARCAQPIQPSVEPQLFIDVKADYKIHRIAFQDILFIESKHEYVTYHLADRKITAYGSLKALESQLPGHRFCRIHKSFIVAKDRVECIERGFVKIGGRDLPVGRSYKESLKEITSDQA